VEEAADELGPERVVEDSAAVVLACVIRIWLVSPSVELAGLVKLGAVVVNAPALIKARLADAKVKVRLVNTYWRKKTLVLLSYSNKELGEKLT
jgi:hypothetical protein